MNYSIKYHNSDEDLLTRLLKIRNINENPSHFLTPTFSDYRRNPFDLHDMDKAVDKIIKSMKSREKIMIFGDYDVDGITSSYILYKFFNKYLKYKEVSIQYPDRIQDGYGLKNKHLDSIKQKSVSLIITVDNGITSIKEAEYAKELGLDIIITDHHHPGEQIPDAFAVINPLVSPNYSFKSLAGVGVAFKLICALLERSSFDKTEKQKIFNYFLPIVAIGTVADVVPLLDENRVIVKKGLELINTKHEHLPSSLKGFLKYLNIKDTIDTFHIGFLIGPRINAGGRIQSPYDSLNMLLYSGDEQFVHLEKIEELNTERKKLQEQAFKIAEQQLDHEQHFLVAVDESFHEGIIGIVSGKITEKYHKPSAVFKIDKEKNQAVASLRGPQYFDIIKMISEASHLLERFGGHTCAGGLTVSLDNLDTVIDIFTNYCNEHINTDQLHKKISLDTYFYPHEWTKETLSFLQQFAPFGEGNPEPVFLFENIPYISHEKVGQNGKGHIKIFVSLNDQKVPLLFRGKGEELLHVDFGTHITFAGKIKKDSYSGGFMIEGIQLY